MKNSISLLKFPNKCQKCGYILSKNLVLNSKLMKYNVNQQIINATFHLLSLNQDKIEFQIKSTLNCTLREMKKEKEKKIRRSIQYAFTEF